MTIANILREQAVALHGKAWARTALPLASLKLGFDDDPVILLFLPIHSADPFAEMVVLAAGEIHDVFIARACECAGFHRKEMCNTDGRHQPSHGSLPGKHVGRAR